LTFTAAGVPDTATPTGDWQIVSGAWQLQTPALAGDVCTVSETGTGGATSISYACAYTQAAASTGVDATVQEAGCPGSASGPSSTPAAVVFAPPDGISETALVTVTNNFPVITAITQDANSVLVTGSGFPANTDATVDIQSTPLVLGTLTADANGAFSKTFAIPCSVGSGSHTVTATAATGQTASTGVTLAACPVVVPIKFTG
jgi:hypothetical protein